MCCPNVFQEKNISIHLLGDHLRILWAEDSHGTAVAWGKGENVGERDIRCKGKDKGKEEASAVLVGLK